MAVYDSAVQLAAGAPLLRLHKLSALYGCRTVIVAKLEYLNPAGSAKDREAVAMLLAAMNRGELAPGGAVVEAAGGNAAVSLAMACAALSLRATMVMPETAEPQILRLVEAYGGRAELTPAQEGAEGARRRAAQLLEAIPGAFQPRPFENDDACQAYRQGAGPEILAQLPQVDYLVAGVGSGAALTGCGEFIKSRCMDCRIIAAEPNESPVLSGGLPGAHSIRGLGAGFVPPILNTHLIDEVLRVRGPDARALCLDLCRSEGVLCGVASGAALAAAVHVACRSEAAGKTLVVLLPDGGERYLDPDLLPR